MPTCRHPRWLTLSLALVAAALLGAACGSRVVDESPDAKDVDGGGGTAPTAGTTDSDECLPYDDDCIEGHYCQFVDGRTQCIPEGRVLRDAPCEEDLCERGSICMFADSLYGNHCQQPCNLAEERPCDIGRHTCFVAVDDDGRELGFGVCRY